MKATILVVDDALETRNLLKFILEQEGYGIVLSSNGREAASLLESFKPDLIIADLVMPKMGGIDLIKSIRSRPELAVTPIIVISAFLSYLEEGKKAGATVAIEKPVDVLELPKIISELLPKTNGAAH